MTLRQTTIGRFKLWCCRTFGHSFPDVSAIIFKIKTNELNPETTNVGPHAEARSADSVQADVRPCIHRSATKCCSRRGYVECREVYYATACADREAAGPNEGMNDIRQIPTNHNVVGTCGKCGGPIISPIFWTSTEGPYEAPLEWCMDCGAKPKKIITASYGAIRKME